MAEFSPAKQVLTAGAGITLTDAGSTVTVAAPVRTPFSTTATWRSYSMQYNTGANYVSGTLYLNHFWVPQDLTMDGMGIQVSGTPASSVNISVGIYTDSGSYSPNTLLKGVTLPGITTSGSKSSTFTDVALTAGAYFFGILCVSSTSAVTNIQVYSWYTGMRFWETNPHGTGASLSVANGNDGSVFTQTSLAALPNPAVATAAGNSNAPSLPAWFALRVRR